MNRYKKSKLFTGLCFWLFATLLCAQRNANYDELAVPKHTLPDVLQCNNGERVTSTEQWEQQRRPELMELFAAEVYGRTPDEHIDVTHQIVKVNNHAMNGKATSQQIKFIFSNGKKNVEALLLLHIPNTAKGKVPVFVGYNFKGNHSTTTDTTVLYSPGFLLIKDKDDPDWERGIQQNRWNLETIIDRGYAVATMCYHDIYPDKPKFRDQSIVSLFSGYSAESLADDEWQAIGAWAWGSSRIVDYLETLDRIDSEKVALMGHSRQGKAALWAGAQDTRFEIVIANESGCGGAALSRRKYGETLSVINTNFPHWFCHNFKEYNNREEMLPVDQHQLIALIAPRKVYVASAEEDRWADPKGEFLSAFHAGPVYQLYGLNAIESDKMPPLHAPIRGDVGYHIRAGVHDVTVYDWARYLDFADTHFEQSTEKALTHYVNPFLGTATLWEPEDLGYVRTWDVRTWGAEVFPGSSLPNAMVQLSPITQFRSGAGYQYEDTVIYGFSHTNKGHWNLLHIPLLPVTGEISPGRYASTFSHDNESAHPGYYRVFLETYGVDAELTSTLRCGFHKYTYPKGAEKKLIADMTRSNNHVKDWNITKEDEHTFSGFQDAEGKLYFYAVANYPIGDIRQVKDEHHEVSLVYFEEKVYEGPLELKIGFSFVSIENAKMNLETEMLHKNFEQVREEADSVWQKLLSKIEVSGGTEREKGLFYSTLYRSFLWPALRSDVNGDFTDQRGDVINRGFRYYTNPSFWDDYRNKLVLLAMLAPDVTTDIIKSITDKGEKSGGYMPTFFHGDHASVFVAGSYLRGIKDFDLNRAYQLLLKNATVPGRGGRPHLKEYLERGWIAEKDTTNVPTWDEYKAAVTKTVEYAYDDYATALIAREMSDTDNYRLLLERSGNYKNLFDPSTGFWRGKIDNGNWIQDFDPYYPYFAYMYREANAWQSLFFAPHDPDGMVALYPSHKAVEEKLDSLFTEPWRGYEAHNMTGFMGNYCHGNQPSHSIPYTYYFIDRQEKAQCVLDSIMDRFYDMGAEGLAYSGMDDAGEMSAWYVFNAIGLYTYSPADPEYIVSVPLFDEVKFSLGDGHGFTIRKEGKGKKIKQIRYGDEILKGWFIQHDRLKEGNELVIFTEVN